MEWTEGDSGGGSTNAIGCQIMMDVMVSWFMQDGLRLSVIEVQYRLKLPSLKSNIAWFLILKYKIAQNSILKYNIAQPGKQHHSGRGDTDRTDNFQCMRIFILIRFCVRSNTSSTHSSFIHPHRRRRPPKQPRIYYDLASAAATHRQELNSSWAEEVGIMFQRYVESTRMGRGGWCGRNLHVRVGARGGSRRRPRTYR